MTVGGAGAPRVERAPWPVRLAMLADWWSLWSTCSKMATGAVVVDPDFQVLVSGVNGAPRGAPHCTDLPPFRDEGDHCLRCIHAEMNCGHQATRKGVSLYNGIMWSTHRPCIRCATNMSQWGLLQVNYREPYLGDPHLEAVQEILGSAGTKLVHQPATAWEYDFHRELVRLGTLSRTLGPLAWGWPTPA